MTYETQRKRKVAIFDLDETLIQSSLKLRTDVANTLRKLGVEISPEEVKGDWYKLAESYGINRYVFDAKFTESRKTWEQSLKDGEVPIYHGVYNLLDKLKKEGVELVLLSKSKTEYTQQKLDYFDLNKYFSDVETVHPKEPSKYQGARNLMERLNPGTISELSFIGDKAEDVAPVLKMRKEYNIPVTHGILIRRNLKERVTQNLPSFNVIKSLEELPKIIGV
ncbi:MAG: HAD hydrolase-like protein [archaeon]